MRIGFAAIPFDKRLLPVTSKKSAAETVERLKAVAGYIHRMGIDFYRIPANVSPMESLESIDEARDEIKALGDLFRKLNIRTCFHVTYYCILNSPDRTVVEKSIDELRCLQLFDRYAGGGNHIELHAGGSYGEREAAVQRFITVVTSLDEDIFKMLRLENEEHPGKIGTVAELRQINRETGIPLLFDIAHYRVNPLEKKLPAREVADSFLDTWRAATTFPTLHYSTTLPTRGTHLPVDPADFWVFVQSLEGLEFDVMLETKEKEKDVLRVKAWKKEHAAVVQ
ncbi:UV damage endonuclease UvsE [Methanocella arvoryzae]|uniref:Predicted UV damage repair endonuclease (UvdE-like) n=1 Tax=Methanocella arvoryzae (strain DSM 22066 / NBRC 105507 / MRE50) TaxID=351160 RepID=Q0W8T0_METAR|nr:UV damage endonuclease UvsE [Methanocella arvoryzae]CAJ35213.1 predicted UV damage repair endonuclease (UvdE-like) [Methanocella arvoryzae MRE50]